MNDSKIVKRTVSWMFRLTDCSIRVYDFILQKKQIPLKVSILVYLIMVKASYTTFTYMMS